VSYAPVHSVRQIGLAVAATVTVERTADRQSKLGASWKLPSMGVLDYICYTKMR